MEAHLAFLFASKVRVIEGIAHNWVSDLLHMNSQLVGAPGIRIQGHARLAAFNAHFSPARQRVTPLAVADHL